MEEEEVEEEEVEEETEAKKSIFSKFSVSLKLPTLNITRRKPDDVLTLEADNVKILANLIKLREDLSKPAVTGGGEEEVEQLMVINEIKDLISKSASVLTDGTITLIENKLALPILRSIARESFENKLEIIRKIVDESKRHNANRVKIDKVTPNVIAVTKSGSDKSPVVPGLFGRILTRKTRGLQPAAMKSASTGIQPTATTGSNKLKINGILRSFSSFPGTKTSDHTTPPSEQSDSDIFAGEMLKLATALNTDDAGTPSTDVTPKSAIIQFITSVFTDNSAKIADLTKRISNMSDGGAITLFARLHKYIGNISPGTKTSEVVGTEVDEMVVNSSTDTSSTEDYQQVTEKDYNHLKVNSCKLPDGDFDIFLSNLQKYKANPKTYCLKSESEYASRFYIGKDDELFVILENIAAECEDKDTIHSAKRILHEKHAFILVYVALGTIFSPLTVTGVTLAGLARLGYKGYKLAGKSAIEYKKKLLAAIKALINDGTACAPATDIKAQLAEYQTLCTGDDKLTAELIKTNYRGFEAGLRKSILNCSVDIKEHAKLVLADYENRASKILTYTQRAKGVFTRKNSEGDSKISEYLDDVKEFIERNEAENKVENEAENKVALAAIEAVRSAVLLPDDKPKFEADIDKQIAELTGKPDRKNELEKLQKAKTEVKGTIEKNVDIILAWLATEKSHEEDKIKVEQAKLKATKSPAEKAEINANIKTSDEKINGGPGIQLRSKSGIRFHERQISSIIDIKQIKRNTTLKKRTFSLFNRSSEKVDNTPKPQFNNIKIGDVLPAFEIIKKTNDDGTPKEFVSIRIEGEEIYIDGNQLAGTDDESRREAWNTARSTLIGLENQIANTLPRFDDGKITLNVYPNGKVTIQLNDGPVVYINNRDELEKFKKDSRKPTQKPSVLSRISKPFKNMFGSNKSSKKEEDVKVDNGEEGLRELSTAEMDRIYEDEEADGMGRQFAKALLQGPGGLGGLSIF